MSKVQCHWSSCSWNISNGNHFRPIGMVIEGWMTHVLARMWGERAWLMGVQAGVVVLGNLQSLCEIKCCICPLTQLFYSWSCAMCCFHNCKPWPQFKPTKWAAGLSGKRSSCLPGITKIWVCARNGAWKREEIKPVCCQNRKGSSSHGAFQEGSEAVCLWDVESWKRMQEGCLEGLST